MEENCKVDPTQKGEDRVLLQNKENKNKRTAGLDGEGGGGRRGWNLGNREREKQ
jgi:hypothetical protein